MRRVRCGVAVVVALVISTAGDARSQGTPPTTVIRAARMLDVKTGTIVPNASIVVTGARITATAAGAAVPPGATVIDLGNTTLMPGLIDSHTHLLQNYEGKFGNDDPEHGAHRRGDGHDPARATRCRHGTAGSRSRHHRPCATSGIRDGMATSRCATRSTPGGSKARTSSRRRARWRPRADSSAVSPLKRRS